MTAKCGIFLLEIFSFPLFSLQLLQVFCVSVSQLAVEAEFLTGPVIRPVSKAWFALVSLAQTMAEDRSRSSI